MAFIIADRVRDITTTTGTGNATLAATPPGTYQAFSAVCANNDTFIYGIAHQSANEWEIGIGTYVSATPAVARTTVLFSSNAGAAVNLSSGTKDIFIGPASTMFRTFVAGNTGATPAPDITKGPLQQWTLNSNTTWGAPTGAYQIGQALTLIVSSTGVFTTAWNAVYRNAPAWAVAANNQKATAMFIYDGTNWQFIGGSTAFA